MWTRRELKTNAKGVLSKFYGISLLMVLAYSAITTLIVQVTNKLGTIIQLIAQIPVSLTQIRFGVLTEYFQNYFDTLYGVIGEPVPAQVYDMFAPYHNVQAAFIYVPILMVIALFIGFVGYTFANVHFEVGYKRFFIGGAKGNAKFSDIGYGFSHNYWNTAKTGFLYTLIVTLGYILIIPGIIFTYQYYFVPYILAENPNLSTCEVLGISKSITKGNKFKIFVMQISFIGWDILSILCLCGLGFLFLEPYRQSVYAQMYLKLKSIAIQGGMVSEYAVLQPFNTTI